MNYTEGEYLRKQESLYWGSRFLYSRWYREIYGGKWRLLKLGKDTPRIQMFMVWTKMGDECWSGYREVLDSENYPYTNVDNKWKLYKSIFISIIKLKFLR